MDFAPSSSLWPQKGKPAMRSMDTLQSTNGPTSSHSDVAGTTERSRERGMLRAGSRDSHDLSMMLEGNRNSVVDHMLLSLDSLPNGSTSFTAPSTTIYSKFSADVDQPSSSEYARRRSVTQPASRSSDYESNAQDAFSSFSKSSPRRDIHNAQHLSRQSTRERIGGGFEDATYTRQNQSFVDDHRGEYVKHRGRSGSKSTTRSSMELGQQVSLPPKSIGLGNRTSSFDQFHNSSSELRMKPDSILSRGRPVPGGYWHQDAAPEPAVHAGPRRRTETAAGSGEQGNTQMHSPLPGYEANDGKWPKRRSSLKSTATRLSRRARPDSEAVSRTPVADVFGMGNGSATALDAMAAPSPSAGYRKDAVSSGSNQNMPKEKAGFFRRVFGSSKTTAAPAPQPDESQVQTRPPTQSRQGGPAPSHPSDSNNERDRPRTQASLRSQSSSSHMAAQMKAQSQTAAPDVPPVPAEHQTLNKKPSSFFRRRKKSVSDSRPPVTIIQQHPKVKNIQAGADARPIQSPSISSLRKIMNPYLSDAQLVQPGSDIAHHEAPDTRSSSAGTGQPEVFTYGQGYEDPQAVRSRNTFAPGNKPYEGATIRTVTPASPAANDCPGSVWRPSSNESPFQTSESQKGRTKLRKSRPSTAKLPDDEAYPANTITNGTRPLWNLSPTQTTFGAYKETERPKTSPTRPFFATEIKENVGPAAHAGGLRKAPSENVRELALNDGRKMQSSFKESLPTTTDLNRLRSPPSQPDSEQDTPYIQTHVALKTQQSPRSNRIWIEDVDSDPKPAPRSVSPLSLPIDANDEKSGEVSPLDPPSPLDEPEIFHSATSLPIVQVDGDSVADEGEHNRNTSDDSTGNNPQLKLAAAEKVATDTDVPQMEDRERAAKIFAGDEKFVTKARAAAWLGETSFVAARTRKAYMELFDWTGFSVLSAFRELCSRLIVKAESQQLDRLVDAFSQHWCFCNPRHGFKAADVVHTISYSILMLNTDLHIADMDSRMTRNEFVRNTLPTIRRIADLAEADGAEQNKAPQLTLNIPGASPPSSPTYPPEQPHIAHASTEPIAGRQSLEAKRPKNRLSLLPPGLDLAISGVDPASDNCTVLVNQPHEGNMKSWESQIEVVLREFYNSIKQTPLPLHGFGHEGQQNNNNLTVSSAGGLRRSPSVLSKAPSETVSYRGRTADMRSATSRWPVGNKARSRPRLYPTSTIGSSRTSLDDQSVWSPAASSTWSKYSYGKSHTQPSSMSVESFGSGFPGDGYSQSIGFANALSQAIIREEHAAGINAEADDLEEFGKVRPLLEDESLELHGAPWAKEGLVKHKHHLEAIDKKAKDRAWNECFAVVEKGYLRLFSFNQTSKSMRKNKKQASRAGGALGGGNWMDNAESLGCFLLRQTLASSLPPPGYSKQRPHVWALSLPTGAVHLFQVGTEDIASEFVKTANYWSARLSKEPLVGGVSNIEYGWGDNVINTALISRTGSVTPSHASGSVSTAHLPRPSIQSSLQGSIRGSSIDGGSSSVRARMPGDRVTISEWSPPVQSMMASQLMEVDQLKALSTYVHAVEEDLDRHNGLRSAMGFAFSPRHPNGQKALANWEKKSAYLLREIVKFKTYVSSLNDAQLAKDKVERDRKERAAVEAARNPSVTGNASDHYDDDLAPETAEAVRRAENAEFDD